MKYFIFVNNWNKFALQFRDEMDKKFDERREEILRFENKDFRKELSQPCARRMNLRRQKMPSWKNRRPWIANRKQIPRIKVNAILFLTNEHHQIEFFSTQQNEKNHWRKRWKR